MQKLRPFLNGLRTALASLKHAANKVGPGCEPTLPTHPAHLINPKCNFIRLLVLSRIGASDT